MTHSSRFQTLSDLSILPGYDEALIARSPSALAKALLLAVSQEDGQIVLTHDGVSVLQFWMVDTLRRANPLLFLHRAHIDTLREAFQRAVIDLSPFLTSNGMTLTGHEPFEQALTDHFRNSMRALHDNECPNTDFDVVVELDDACRARIQELLGQECTLDTACVLARTPSKASYRRDFVSLIGTQAQLHITRFVEHEPGYALLVKPHHPEDLPIFETRPYVLVRYVGDSTDKIASPWDHGPSDTPSFLLEGMIKIVPATTL